MGAPKNIGQIFDFYTLKMNVKRLVGKGISNGAGYMCVVGTREGC